MNSIDFNKMNEYLMNKKESICIEETTEDILGKKVDTSIVLGMAANLNQWGYLLSNECVQKLMLLSEKSVVNIYDKLVKTLKEIKGDDVSHDTLLFKNFPDSCRTISAEDLSTIRFISYYAALIDHCFGTDYYKTTNWDGEVVERTSEVKHDNLRTINLATEEDFKRMLNNMLSSRMSLSEYDKEILDFGIKNFGTKEIIPDEIPFKENWAYIIKKAISGEIDYNFKFKTMTDFIRAGVALSDGDLSLSTKPKFKPLKNQERKILLTKLNLAAKYNKEEFVESLINKRNNRLFYNIILKGWKIDLTLPKFKALNEAWKEANEKYSKLSLAEQSIDKGDFLSAGKYYLSAGSGYLIRHANALLEKVNKEDKFELLSLIQTAAEQTAIPVLLNAKAALDSPDVKVAFIKGSASKIHAYENKREMDNDSKTLLSYVYDKAIESQLTASPSLGNIYLDEKLKDCPLPFAQRANNGKNRAVERGTRLDANPDKNIIRGFVYKKCKESGFYDLSASFVDDKFNLIEQISWTQLKVDGLSKPLSVHSGDNPNSKEGCTEFIDIDLEAVEEYASKMKEKDPTQEIRYIAFQVYAWNGVPFSNMERCFFGVMERDNLASDKVTPKDLEILKKHKVEIENLNNGHDICYFHLSPEQLKLVEDYKPEIVFDPATVQYRYDLTGDTRMKVPMLYDIKEHKYIFTDLDIPGRSDIAFIKKPETVKATVSMDEINLYDGASTPLLENYVNQTALVCHSVVDMKKPNIYDFMKLYAKSTNTRIVSDSKEADVIFTTDRVEGSKVITPFDTDELSKIMTPEKAKVQNIEH